ncbi:MAG: hypothetical protein ACR2KK_05570 [Acidimicrobiales bacterium]
MRHMVGYVEGIIADRRAHPREDLVTMLVETQSAGERLTDAELVSPSGDLLLGGAERRTTSWPQRSGCLPPSGPGADTSLSG